MAEGIGYLDVDDEITSAASRIRNAPGTKVALVVPYGSRISTSRMNFRLLSREAVINNRRLSIVAGDPATRALAAPAPLPVLPTRLRDLPAQSAGPDPPHAARRARRPDRPRSPGPNVERSAACPPGPRSVAYQSRHRF